MFATSIFYVFAHGTLIFISLLLLELKSAVLLQGIPCPIAFPFFPKDFVRVGEIISVPMSPKAQISKTKKNLARALGVFNRNA